VPSPLEPVLGAAQLKSKVRKTLDTTFKFDKERNVYVCPAGKLLKTTGRILSDNTFRYFASTYDCRPCPLKSKCCPNAPQRKIPRDINEDARDYARALYGTPEFDKSRNERKKVEMRFAHLKTHQFRAHAIKGYVRCS